MKTASWFRQLEEDTIECILCPHNCRLQDGMTGICRVRTNHSGVLMAESYGLISAIHADPVEKKPLYHYFPGRTILSIGSVGCNLRCRFCQNFEISQVSVKDFVGLISYSPGQIIEAARSIPGNIGIAYTYNEPIVGYEFMMDVSKLAGQSGLKNVLVTNGYINPDPLSGLLSCMDAFSVDSARNFTGKLRQPGLSRF